jgi:Na+-transporting NADH:ubiquinone oxidoreductase subunit A
VRLGQPLVRRKRISGVVGTAPGSGVVEAIHRGPRRALETIVIRLDDEAEDADQETFNRYRPEELDALSPAQVRENLLASGAWLSLRTRPFGLIADPQTVPEALFVTAMDSRPLATDPVPLIQAAGADFEAGLRVVTRLTEHPTFVCTRPGAGLHLPPDPRIRLAEFAGPHPAGLPGTHIHFLRPANRRRVVWHLGWQDVIAIGRLFTTGRIDPTRLVALCGPMVRDPRILSTRLGASTNELIEGELIGPQESRVISGSALCGRHAVGSSAFLGRFHNQITVLAEDRGREWLGWLKPGRGRYSALNLYWSRRRPGEPMALGTSLQGSPRAMVPIGAYERVMPLDLLPTQLLRALLVEDLDTAVALGALELDEEDLALASFVDCGKHDFGVALRRTLDQIRHEQGSAR